MDKQQIISAVASTSNSFSTVSFKKYDVFLSFQGGDTRRNFTSHLHNALKQKKVETYIDYRLEKGAEISPALIKAIEDSHISLVVFSENYASSKWCLAELNKILECKKDQGQVVIPVFYNIDPSHVRKQIGSYKQAFAKHEGELKCNKWKTALTEAANLAGWDSQTYRFFDDCIKCKEENEQYTALCIKDSKERIRKMSNKVELSVSSYDTAWAAMIPCPSSLHAPFFPWCLNWLLGNQLFDGSWGLPTHHPLLMIDALFSTFSCILALKAIGCW